MNRRDEFKVYHVDEATWDTVWQTIKGDCSFLTDWGIQCLSNGLKESVKSIILEPHYLCKDHRNLYSNYYSKKFLESSPFTSRLHFFSTPDVKTPEFLLIPDGYQSSYIGFSVIRPVVDRCIGRTIIDPLKLNITDKSNFFCLRTEFKANIGGRRFTVSGYPYISQDGDVTVCAHTSLWGVCRYLSERYMVYKEVYPFDLINLTGNTEGRTFPYRGMTYNDYSSILSEFGTFPVVLRLKDFNGKIYRDDHRQLYTYIESGFPVVGSLPEHVVTIIGHTLDLTQSPKPDGEGLIDSSEFIKEYIIVDDNYFPYQFLGKPGTTNKYGSFSIDDLKTAVCPLPEKVFLPAESAKSWALAYLRLGRTALETTGTGPFVTRLFLTSNSSFKARCLQRSFQNGSIDVLSYYPAEINLPHFVWVMEVGPLDLYRQGKCTGEVVLDSTASNIENSMIYMRFGNHIFFDRQALENKNGPIAYSQYTHNLGEK
jgi:hypothetical protein